VSSDCPISLSHLQRKREVGLFSHPVLMFGINALLKVTLRTTQLVNSGNFIQRFSNEKFASFMVNVIMIFGGAHYQLYVLVHPFLFWLLVW
jgi:hypothetical protein